LNSPRDGLSARRIAQAIEEAGLKPISSDVAEKFSRYYALLEQWNSKLNLTAIRDPEEALHRHFVECIFCAQHLPQGIISLLDYGSGAGFPGIPIALCRPEIHVTLAESQGKKASFLREVVRSMGGTAEVYSGRVETMPALRSFDAVSLRAVDEMQAAVRNAASRVHTGGWLVLMATAGSIELPGGFQANSLAITGSLNGILVLAARD
jgi:16S rRNA (guanine527-N7)-methyltransferase